MSIDVLERNVINYAIEKDVQQNLNKVPSARKNEYLQNVIDAVNNCGVSFSVWHKKNENGGNSDVYDWTSMVGNEKIVLQHYQLICHKSLEKPIVKLLLKYGRL